MNPKLLPSLAAAAVACVATPAFACDAAATSSGALGPYSPAAIRAAAPPWVATAGGFGCNVSSVLTLLSGNYVRATVAAGSTMTLRPATGTDTVAYTLAATSTGASPLVPGTATYFVNGSVLNLLGSATASVPVYAKVTSAATVAPGTYTGTVDIRWEWYFCPFINAVGICIGTVDRGDKTTRVTLTLTVEPRPVTMTIGSVTTWEASASTNAPKALPGSKRRTTITVTNPDIVALDLNALSLVLPTAAKTVVALDGDGATADVVQKSDGSPSSTLTLAYANPASTTDDVDFSSNGGTSWTYVPVAGDAATQGAVTQVRFRPQGRMAALSSYSVSIPYSVK